MGTTGLACAPRKAARHLYHAGGSSTGQKPSAQGSTRGVTLCVPSDKDLALVCSAWANPRNRYVYNGLHLRSGLVAGATVWPVDLLDKPEGGMRRRFPWGYNLLVFLGFIVWVIKQTTVRGTSCRCRGCSSSAAGCPMRRRRQYRRATLQCCLAQSWWHYCRVLCGISGSRH